ncbi:hypothetical protein STEG23_010204, partial [Scotinomys teguina]
MGSEAAGRVEDSLVVNGILGDSVTFPLNIQEPQKVRNIAWTSESSVAFIKPGPQGEPPDVTVTQVTYEGRITVIDQNYDLLIKDLRMTDAGTYKADINKENTPTTTKRYHLHIYCGVSKEAAYAEVSRNAHPTEFRIYDEIPESKVLFQLCNTHKVQRYIMHPFTEGGQGLWRSIPVSSKQMLVDLGIQTKGNGASRNSTRTVVNGVLGGSTTLPLELPEGTKTIVWHYVREASSPTTTILFVQLNKSESPQVVRPDPKRGKRLHITQSYSLQVSNLTMTDTGLYTAQITREDSAPDFFTYTLRVFERLSNLEVTNHTHLFENGTCEIHLTCIVENPNHTVSIGWQASGSISLREPNLTVSWDPKNSSDQSYTCQAENAVSNLSVSVSAQSLCTGVLTKENLYWTKMSVAIVSLLLIAVFICIYIWKNRTGSLSLASHHPDFSQNTDTPGVPGNTVYAQVTHPIQEMEIPKSIKNDSMTIYSIVNHSRQDLPYRGSAGAPERTGPVEKYPKDIQHSRHHRISQKSS